MYQTDTRLLLLLVRDHRLVVMLLQLNLTDHPDTPLNQLEAKLESTLMNFRPVLMSSQKDQVHKPAIITRKILLKQVLPAARRVQV